MRRRPPSWGWVSGRCGAGSATTAGPGRRVWSRLEQFAAASHHPALASAAENLGIHADVLRRRIRELELDLGGELLNRAHAQRPMTLTPLGQAVLDALDQTQPNPQRDSPMPRIAG
ncbi:LysR family transcriptional regulator [Nocardia sp. NPDC051911]|uniref:LysR family transcriptional regulator n=1 Tax=Nocardia sp. NPDC051911 TaxID=3154648 RepID=UPI00344A5EF5